MVSPSAACSAIASFSALWPGPCAALVRAIAAVRSPEVEQASALGLPDGLARWSLRHDAGEVDERAGHGGDGDAVDLRDVLGCEDAPAVDPDPCGRPPARPSERRLAWLAGRRP